MRRKTAQRQVLRLPEGSPLRFSSSYLLTFFVMLPYIIEKVWWCVGISISYAAVSFKDIFANNRHVQFLVILYNIRNRYYWRIPAPVARSVALCARIAHFYSCRAHKKAKRTQGKREGQSTRLWCQMTFPISEKSFEQSNQLTVCLMWLE